MRESSSAHRTVKLISALLLAASLGFFVFGLLHVSETPEVLGRYSRSYALLLSGLAFVVAGLAWASVRVAGRLATWVGNVYLLLFSTLFVLVAVEVGLRVLNPWGIDFFSSLPYHMQGMVDDPELGYAHPRSVSYELGRNVVKLNAHGLRDEEIAFAKANGERRILVLGDSVAFGWGVSQGEPFPERMEPLLSRRTARPWQVINAGVNGYNTVQEAAYFTWHGLRYSPDGVILVFVSNDVNPVLDPNETTWRRYPQLPSSLPELMERWRHFSYLYQTVRMFMVRTKQSEATSGSADSSITRAAGWAESRAALLVIADACKTAGIPFLVARESGNDVQFFDQMKELGIAAISLQAAWEGIPHDKARVSTVDAHPSALAHERFAQVLVDEIERRGWLR